MKERLLKRGVVLFLVAALVVAGVLASHPVTSQAAAKGTTYNVTIQKGSPTVSIVSINSGVGVPQPADNGSTTFQMVVESKAKTEKLPTGPASYYPVTIIAKSWKAPTAEFQMIGGGGTARQVLTMQKDAKGKLYISGGDVDVSTVFGSKAKITIGDGTVDPAGSMIIPVTTVSIITLVDTGKVFLTTIVAYTMTTGKSYIVLKGTKARLEGKALPNDDTSKNLPTPLVGKPIDLAAGTGTLVGGAATLGTKNKQLGLLDYLNSALWVLSIK